jgi:hypothetical protein
MGIMKMTDSLKKSVNASESENKTDFLPEIQIAYSTSKAVKDSMERNRLLQEAGKETETALFPGNVYFYAGKDEDERVKFRPIKTPLQMVVIDILGEAEAWKNIRSQDKSVEDTCSMEFNPDCEKFAKRPEYTEFCEEYEDEDDITIKLSHRVLVYLPESDEFATLYYKYSTTEDYAQMMSFVGGIIELKIYEVPLKQGTWYRFRAKPVGDAPEIADTRIEEAKALFLPKK